MSSLGSMCATRFLYLADSFLTVESPLDAIHCAELAVRSDRTVWEKSGAVVKAAAELKRLPSEPLSDELVRLRWHVQRLETVISTDNSIRESLPEPPSDSEHASDHEPSLDSLAEELRRVERRLPDCFGEAFDRARRTLRNLLDEFGSPEDHASLDESCNPSDNNGDDWIDECFSLEHSLHNLGNRLYKMERYDDAIVFYDVALETCPTILEGYFNRGLAYTRLGRYVKAEADLDQAIQLNEDIADLWYVRGLIQKYKRDYESAIADFERALQIDPDFLRAEEQRKAACQLRDGKERGPHRPGANEDYDGVVDDFTPYRVKPDCRLSQVGDHAAVKRELQKILTYLRGSEILAEWGAELPRGVLLYGQTGVGKTHLARALAGEARCPFYAPPISLILDMYVGNSEKNLRNLFRAAGQHEHAIVFLDEIEVIASQRKESRQSHEPWQARLAACLLEEMDNLPGRNGRVVVIGATNSLDAVDPCFLRPGRFTYVIEVKPPATAGLVEILLICLEVAARRAKRNDFLDAELEKAVLAPRQQWLEQALQHDATGLVQVARIAARKELVGDHLREIVRRIVDERVIAGMDGIDLGPVTTEDLQRHVEQYRPVRL